MKIPSVAFSHIGIHVHDIDGMVDFYTRVLGMHVTDRGHLEMLPGAPAIVFLSRDPNEHHQIALVGGREDAEHTARIVNQISFHAASLADLRSLQQALLAERTGGPTFALNHGMSWSLYSHDPEGNMLEFCVDSPWYVPQPVADFLDLSQSDDDIRRVTEAAYKDRQGFRPLAEWRAELARKIAAG